MKKKQTPFEEYYNVKLKKDTLTNEEFNKMIIDYFLGFNYYIIDPVSGEQANRIILEDIMKRFPQNYFRKKNDKIWLDRYKSESFQRELERNEK